MSGPDVATDATPSKTIQDRKAMPPPPFITKSSTNSSGSISPPDTPKASSTNTSNDVPSFALSSSSDPEPKAHFPALNSAQRASSIASRNTTPSNFQPTKAQPLLRDPSINLMTPPTRSPLPNRNPTSQTSSGLNIPSRLQATTSGLTPPPTHTSIPTKPRKKVQLTPGHSPLDWATLCRSTSNLNGLPTGTSYLKVPPSLLRQFNGRRKKDPLDGTYTRNEAWTVLSGKVYNITPYAEYHPGGVEELMKCAGRDGTKLFGEVHPWVNWEGMLSECLVGIAVSEEEFERLRVRTDGGGGDGDLEEMD